MLTPLVETPHKLRFEGVSFGFGLPYTRVHTREEFAEAYGDARKMGRTSVIEVVSEKDANLEHHRSLEAAIRGALEAEVTTPLVLLHGFLGSSADFGAVDGRTHAGASERGGRPPGHGPDPEPLADDTTFDEVVEGLRAFVDQIEDGPRSTCWATRWAAGSPWACSWPNPSASGGP